MKRRRGKSMSKRPVLVTCLVCKEKLRRVDAVALNNKVDYTHHACLERIRA